MLVRDRQLVGRLVVEHELNRSAALRRLVLEPVGRIAHETHLPAEMLGGADSELQPVTLQIVETVDGRVRSETYVPGVQESVDNHLGQGVDILVEWHVLDGVNHVVDALLLRAQRIRADTLPIVLIVVDDILAGLHLGVDVLLVFPVGGDEIRIGVVYLPVSQECDYLG